MIDHSSVSQMFLYQCSSTVTATGQYESQERLSIRFDVVIQELLQDAARMLFVCNKY